MKIVLRLEELMKFLFAYIITVYLGFECWLFFAFLLAPDISMLAYLINTRTGAVFYNIFHHQGIAVITGLAGLFMNSNELIFAGLLLFGHSSMDRVFGYGLKYPDNFKNTHLGRI
jgi:hypothetical protein